MKIILNHALRLQEQKEWLQANDQMKVCNAILIGSEKQGGVIEKDHCTGSQNAEHIRGGLKGLNQGDGRFLQTEGKEGNLS